MFRCLGSATGSQHSWYGTDINDLQDAPEMCLHIYHNIGVTTLFIITQYGARGGELISAILALERHLCIKPAGTTASYCSQDGSSAVSRLQILKVRSPRRAHIYIILR